MVSVRVATAPQSRGIPYRDEGFAKHAAPQAIEVHLRAARAEARRAQRVVAWLEDLAALRQEQIAAGEWPPSTERSGGTNVD